MHGTAVPIYCRYRLVSHRTATVIGTLLYRYICKQTTFNCTYSSEPVLSPVVTGTAAFLVMATGRGLVMTTAGWLVMTGGWLVMTAGWLLVAGGCLVVVGALVGTDTRLLLLPEKLQRLVIASFADPNSRWFAPPVWWNPPLKWSPMITQGNPGYRPYTLGFDNPRNTLAFEP